MILDRSIFGFVYTMSVPSVHKNPYWDDYLLFSGTDVTARINDSKTYDELKTIDIELHLYNMRMATLQSMALKRIAEVRQLRNLIYQRGEEFQQNK